MSKASAPLVSIVILNWNRIADTLVCLESVRKITYSNFEIIVVDNGSTDGSKEKLAKISDIKLVDNQVNKGFTGGHVDGYAKSKGEFIFILNNDAVVAPDCLDVGIKQMQKDDSIAVVGGRAYHWGEDQQPQDKSNAFYAWANINPVSAEAIFPQADNNKAQVVNSVSGSATLIRRAALEKVGYFYIPYFAYYEETDLFARMKRVGYKIIYNPALCIWHKNGSSSSSYFQYNQIFKNRFIFALRNFESSYLPAFLKSYIKIGLRSTYMRFRPSDDPALHRGFSNAFFKSMFTWPRHLFSRWQLSQSLGKTTTGYNTALISETVSLSVVCDLSSASAETIKTVVQHYEELLGNYDQPIDIVICLPADSKLETSLRTARVTKSYMSKSLSLGWLTAKNEYLVFTEVRLTAEDLNKHFKSAVQLSLNRSWLAFTPGQSWSPVHRKLLINGGGIVSNKLDNNSYQILCLYAELWGKDKLLTNDSIKSKFSSQKIADVSAQVYIDKLYDRVPSAWDGFLARHYRIYQLRNFIKWWVSPKITLRIKLARTKNLALFALSLKRLKFATELKHIRNEIVRASSFGHNIQARTESISRIINDYSSGKNWQNLAVYIICRDRLDSLKILIDWLESRGMTNIILIDNDSIYPRLVNYLDSTKYQVIRTGTNIGHTIPWTGGVVHSLSTDQPYIVTDPDVIPDKDCPSDVIPYFLSLHKKYIDYLKVGFGLRIDDLPDKFPLKKSVIEWESQFWKQELEPGVYEAGVDTTFALYKPYSFSYTLHPSLRTGAPYVARHLPWYIDPKEITTEEQFYRDRVNNKITSWNVAELDERYKREMAK